MLQDPTSKEVVGGGKEEDGIYKLKVKNEEETAGSRKETVGEISVFNAVNCNLAVNLDVLHARLGHTSSSKMKHIDICKCKHLKDYFCDS